MDKKKNIIIGKGPVAKQLEPPIYVISVPDWQHLTNKIKLIPCIKAINFFPNLGLVLLGVAITTLISIFTSPENQMTFLVFFVVTLIPGLILFLSFPKKRDIQIKKLEWCKNDICNEIEHFERRYRNEEQNNEDQIIT